MSEIFLYRIKETDDRDACAYIEPPEFECGHYFRGIILHGSCYCNSDWKEYSEIETVLTEAEYSALRDFDEQIGKFGYGIKQGSEKYEQGMKLCANIQPIFDKLNGEEAREFYEQIIAEEKQIVMDEYGLSEEQVETAFREYPLADSYQDRSIVGSIFDDVSDLGYEEAFSLGYIKKDDFVSEKYFDYEKFGQDLVDEEEMFLELDDGRCVCYMM